MTTVIRITAWKKCSPTHITPCEPDDPDAIRFNVHFPGAYNGSPEDFQRLCDAKRFSYGIERAYEAGKKAAMAELRAFIGEESTK